MKVSGFTFLRKAVLYGYPFIESIRSALPLVDEFIVVVGECDDGTREQVAAIGDPRIRIVDTQWNENVQPWGFVLGQQKMIGQFNCTGDWALYIEGDEVLHEDDIASLRASMERHLHDARVEALYVDFLHFYGSPDWLAISHSWYRQEARIIRNTLKSFTTDSLYFLVIDGKKSGRYPRAASAGARYFHYGNCRKREQLSEKAAEMFVLSGHGNIKREPSHYYRTDRRLLEPFSGTHPAAMRDWLEHSAEHGFEPTIKPRLGRRERRNLWGVKISRLTGIDFSKRHFKKID